MQDGAVAAGVVAAPVRARQFSNCASASGRVALADARRAGEDQAGRQRAAQGRARQQLEEPPVAGDVAEGHARR